MVETSALFCALINRTQTGIGKIFGFLIKTAFSFYCMKSAVWLKDRYTKHASKHYPKLIIWEVIFRSTMSLSVIERTFSLSTCNVNINGNLPSKERQN